MAALARREYSTHEMIAKLVAKGADESDAMRMADLLCDEGVLSDTRFTEQFVASRVSRGFGPLKILAECHARGIADELVERVLATHDDEWGALAMRAWQKRFKGQYAAEFAGQAQQANFLQNKGFRVEHIEFVFRGACAESDSDSN